MPKAQARFIFVIGGVMSGIGKGIATASIARILKSKGFRVTCVKIDPYLNVDAGTMNPVEHGEVFVTEDGMETDQDVGNYERFLNENIYAGNYLTSGSVYLSVIERERALGYRGACVQPVPHVPEEIIRRLERAATQAKAEFVLVEVGGTAGEYENLLFLEAARMMHLKDPERVLFVLLSYLPIPVKIGEMKTKPTQHAARALNSAGVQPDFIIARAAVPLDAPRKRKLSIFCNVREEDIISAPDVNNIYEVPLNFEKEGLGDRILKKCGLKSRARDMKDWAAMVRRASSAKKEVKIGIVGKYFGTGKFILSDSYISVIEAIKHAAWHWGQKPQILWLDAEAYEKDSHRMEEELSSLDGILVPGGFGKRGVEGKIKAVEYARTHAKPYLGLCYGMHMMTIEFARNVLGMQDANTTEVDPKTTHPVIDVMAGQKEKIFTKNMGGTMRLGAYRCRIEPHTIAAGAYGVREVKERHRHRYEFNDEFKAPMAAGGMIISGTNPESGLAEIMELKGHPFFVGTQFHPEFTSRPLSPHPLFREFIRAAIKE